MPSEDLELALLALLYAVLYINVRARSACLRRMLAGAFFVAVIGALALVPQWVFSDSKAPVLKSKTAARSFAVGEAPLLLAYAPRTGKSFALATEFEFDAKVGLSTRFITPNGDGLNDYAVFTFANPADAAVTGRIFDLRGALVAEMSTHPRLNARYNRVWNGKSFGSPALPGIYIYRLEAEDKAYTGTLAVVR